MCGESRTHGFETETGEVIPSSTVTSCCNTGDAMGESFRYFLYGLWRFIKALFGWLCRKMMQHVVFTSVVVALVLILFIFSAYKSGWEWTGFNSGTSQITITSTSKVNYTATVPQPSKSLWDWLQLLAVLAIPVVVGIGAALFTVQQGKVSERENKDNQRETALQAYIDKMSELLLEKNLRDSAEEDEVRKIARVRTLTILPRLDANRKGSVLQFLYESGLIDKDKRIIDMSGADLQGANLDVACLPRVDLRRANLSGADLGFAKLNETILVQADLSQTRMLCTKLHGANLSGAYLFGADLRKANLRNATGITIEELKKHAATLQGTTMPDGSKYKPDESIQP